MNYLIMYDVTDGDEEKYRDVGDALDRLGAIRVQDSVWYLPGSTRTTKQLAARLGKILDLEPGGDRLIIAPFEKWLPFNNLPPAA